MGTQGGSEGGRVACRKSAEPRGRGVWECSEEGREGEHDEGVVGAPMDIVDVMDNAGVKVGKAREPSWC